MGPEGDSESLHATEQVLHIGEILTAVEDHVLEEVSDSALVIGFVERSGSDVKAHRDPSGRFDILADGIAHAVGQGSETDLGIVRDVTRFMRPGNGFDHCGIGGLCKEEYSPPECEEEEGQDGESILHMGGCLGLLGSLQTGNGVNAQDCAKGIALSAIGCLSAAPFPSARGGIGRRASLRGWYLNRMWKFESSRAHFKRLFFHTKLTI